jgi:hypothetical protein
VKRLAAALLVLALALAGAGLGARGDPKKRITPADQARAKAMLLRKSDFSPAFRAGPASPGSDFYCAALDESDLTVTGQAESPSFSGGIEFVASTSYVYASRANANASWRRGTSAAGQQCLRRGLQSEIQGTRVKLVSFRKLPFPAFAQRSVLYRVVAEQQGGVRVYLDLVALQHSRAQVAVVYGSGLSPPPAAEERRLAKLTAARMAKAMGGR